MLKMRWSVVALLAVSAVAWPQGNQGAVQKALDAYVAQNRVVGASAAIAEWDGTVYATGSGFQDRENNISAGPSTLYRLGSISKPVTAVAALQMVEAGKLSLFADVRRFAPEWPDKGVSITLRHLLTHSSGIRHYLPLKSDVFYEEFTVQRSLDVFKNDDLLFKPGERTSYSTHAFSLVARLVEVASGESFAEYIQTHISQPAQAPSLALENRSKPNAARSKLYSAGATGRATLATREENISWKNGGGGMESSAPDLARFGLAALKNQLNSSHTTQFMSQRQIVDGLDTERGLGWDIDADGNPVHAGAQQGCRTYLLIDKKARRVVVVMTNTGGSHPIGELAKSVASAWISH